MDYIILSLLTGLIVGFSSNMFYRTRSIFRRVINVLLAVVGSLLLGVLAHLLNTAIPIPAVAAAGALAAIVLLMMFRKPEKESRGYYL